MDILIRRFPVVLGLLVWGVTIGFAAPQQPPPPPPATPGTTTGAEPGLHINGMFAVKGEPYSADETTVTTQTLADGTTITEERRIKVYRDSEGRIRREFFGPQKETREPDETPLNVQIVDPVTGVDYDLNPRTHTARKLNKLHATPLPRPTTTTASMNHPAEQQKQTREDLGTQVIEGVNAKGSRITGTIPAGAQGNDRPIEFTHESWYSSELHVTVMSTHKDPRTGEWVMRLTNLSRDEPAAELFQIPPDYTVEELEPVAKPESTSE